MYFIVQSRSISLFSLFFLTLSCRSYATNSTKSSALSTPLNHTFILKNNQGGFIKRSEEIMDCWGVLHITTYQQKVYLF